MKDVYVHHLKESDLSNDTISKRWDEDISKCKTIGKQTIKHIINEIRHQKKLNSSKTNVILNDMKDIYDNNFYKLDSNKLNYD